MEWRGMLIIEKNAKMKFKMKFQYDSPHSNFIFKRVGTFWCEHVWNNIISRAICWWRLMHVFIFSVAGQKWAASKTRYEYSDLVQQAPIAVFGWTSAVEAETISKIKGLACLALAYDPVQASHSGIAWPLVRHLSIFSGNMLQDRYVARVLLSCGKRWTLSLGRGSWNRSSINLRWVR